MFPSAWRSWSFQEQEMLFGRPEGEQPDAVVEELSKTIEFTHWGQAPGHRTICRFVTSWATTEEELEVMEKTLNDAH